MGELKSGGGWAAVKYAAAMALRSGNVASFFRALKSKNACRTCALGMGGQRGGMVDESGHFPEVCKKSLQALVADMQPPISEAFFESHGFDALSALSPFQLEHAGRLAFPVMAEQGADRYRRIDWDEAMAWCIERLTSTPPNQNFFYMSGRSSNEAGFLLQLFARLYGTNNVNNCSFYCHQASGVGLGAALGTGTATVRLEDLRQCDTVFLIGGNPASNHPRLMRRLMDLRRKGGEVIVVNPLRELGLDRFSVPSDTRSLLLGSQIASCYVQPHIGGDIAFLYGVAKCIDSWGALDTGFINSCTDGGQSFLESLRLMPWSQIVERSGVSKPAMEDVARRYARSERTIFAWTMGITHHRHGVDNVRAIVNLALLRGMVGKEGAGMLPIRGHSNVQGIGSVGVTPALKEKVFDAIEAKLGCKLPKTQGLDTLACLEAAERGALRSGWCLGGNLYGASPRAAWAGKALAGLESLVYLSTTLNTGHAMGRAKNTLILPMRVRDEESQATTQESMFNFVRLSDGGDCRISEARSEVETIAQLGQGVLGDDGPIDWSALREHREIRQLIGSIVPGYERIAAIDESRDEFHIRGRTLHRPEFATASGRAKFDNVPVPTSSAAPGALRLMTIRSEGQFNTVVYEEEDVYRHQPRRRVIMMNREDILRLNLSVGQAATVSSEAGTMEGVEVREVDIRQGNAAMYFPEANVLGPTETDPKSRTPAYKGLSVTVTPASPR